MFTHLPKAQLQTLLTEFARDHSPPALPILSNASYEAKIEALCHELTEIRGAVSSLAGKIKHQIPAK